MQDIPHNYKVIMTNVAIGKKFLRTFLIEQSTFPLMSQKGSQRPYKDATDDNSLSRHHHTFQSS